MRPGHTAHLIIAVIVVFIIDVTTSVPVHANYDEAVEIRLLAEESNSDLRVRRAADSNLADHLHFAVPLRGESVELRLKRSRLLPTVTSDSSLDANRFSQNAAVYTDLASGSAMIVKRDTEGYALKGSFIHADNEWSVEPLSRETRDAGERESGRRHGVAPMIGRNETISFFSDTMTDTQERPQLIDIWRSRGRGNGQQQQRQQQQQQQQQGEGNSQQQQGGQQSHNQDQNMGGNRRHKRAATQHVVEMAFIVDYADYQNWVQLVGASDALQELRLWYTYVAESIRVRYETINDPDIAITTTVTILKVLTDDADDDFIEDLTDADGDFNGFGALPVFQDWYLTQSDLPLSDHYMLFTGFDIIGASGVAISSRVCTAAGVSISENNFSGTIGGVAAHELGHSLSAIHDVDTGSCSDSDQFVMAAVFSTPVQPANEGNPWRFSSCSIQAFKTYLSGRTCTLPENTSGQDELPAPAAGQRAGEVLSRDDQCRRAKDDTRSFFCLNVQERFGGIEALCGGMYCNLPDSGGSCETTVPQEFTPCNTGKWCVAGKCVDVPVTTEPPPTTTTTTTPAPTTTTTTTPAPTTTTTTTTTTPAPTTTTTTPAPTTTTTTTTPAPTTTTTTPAPTTTTTTPAPPPPTTTTTTPTPTTTTTSAPTTTTTTTTTSAPTTSTTQQSTTTTTPAPPPTQSQEELTTTTTTAPPTTTTAAATTTATPSGPTSFGECTQFIRDRDFNGWWDCIRTVLRYFRDQSRRQQEEERRRQQQQDLDRRREEQRRRNQRRRNRS